MVVAFCRKTKQPPTWNDLSKSILRNFGGLETVNPVDEFAHYITNIDHSDMDDKAISPDMLIRASLLDSGDGVQRYLLILTEAYAALGILQHYMKDMRDAITIFGSSFPEDQEYTQVDLYTVAHFDVLN